MKPSVTINLDKPRTLRYGINALAKIEDLTGKPLSKLDLTQVGIKDILIITYAGLAHEDKDLTIEKVGDLIDEHSDITEVATCVGEALTQAFGNDKAIKQGN